MNLYNSIGAVLVVGMTQMPLNAFEILTSLNYNFAEVLIFESQNLRHVLTAEIKICR